MSDLDLSDVGPEHFASEVDAQIIEMNARLETQKAKNRPIEMQNNLRIRIAIMEKLRSYLLSDAAPPAAADAPAPEPDEEDDDISDEIVD